jgi:hypothetical protein
MGYLGNNLYAANTSYRVIDNIASSFNGVTTSFPLKVGGFTPVPFPINPQNCLISVGGVPQQPDITGTDGFTFSGSNIVFSSAPAAGEKFWGVILAGADYVLAGITYPNGSANAPSITFSSNTSTGLFLSSTNVLGIATGGVQAVTIDSSQQVGIGTTSPNRTLHVYGDQAFSNSNNTGTLLFAPASSANYIYSRAADNSITAVPLVFAVGSADAARIDTSGRLLVGTTNTDPAGNNVTGIALAPGSVSSFQNGSSTALALGASANTTTYNSVSDKRLKDNIQDSDSALNSIKAVKVRSFDWKVDGISVEYGLIAQEALLTTPEVVSVPDDPDQMMGVDFGRITPRLIKAFQELVDEVESLKAEVAALKGA